MPYFFGDSIAVGYGKDYPGRRQVGASPALVRDFLKSSLRQNPTAFNNQIVNLSTGVSNNPSDFGAIKEQLELLKSTGATVNLFGASNQRYARENEKLKGLALEYGVNFLGGFNAGPDGVHPKSYENLPKTVFNFSGQQPEPSQSPEDTIVLAKLKGVTGTLNKSTGKFEDREWSTEESERYNKYLAARNAARQYQGN